MGSENKLYCEDFTEEVTEEIPVLEIHNEPEYDDEDEDMKTLRLWYGPDSYETRLHEALQNAPWKEVHAQRRARQDLEALERRRPWRNYWRKIWRKTYDSWILPALFWGGVILLFKMIGWGLDAESPTALRVKLIIVCICLVSFVVVTYIRFGDNELYQDSLKKYTTNKFLITLADINQRVVQYFLFIGFAVTFPIVFFVLVAAYQSFLVGSILVSIACLCIFERSEDY